MMTRRGRMMKRMRIIHYDDLAEDNHDHNDDGEDVEDGDDVDY